MAESVKLLDAARPGNKWLGGQHSEGQGSSAEDSQIEPLFGSKPLGPLIH